MNDYRRNPDLEHATYALTKADDGTWTYEVFDPSGTSVRTASGFTTFLRARNSASQYGRSRGWSMLNLTPKPRKPYKKREPKEPKNAHLSDLAERLHQQANDAEARAVAMRQSADALELDAKRLRSAAEVLES